MAVVLICGGTGLIGRRLCELLAEKKHEVIVLTRSIKKQRNGSHSFALWNPDEGVIDLAALAKADYIINLAGAGIADKRWTEKRKKIIIGSRVKTGQLIVKALQENPNKVRAVINASAMGWYGDDSRLKDNETAFTEEMSADTGFLGKACAAWEASIDPVTQSGKRLVKIRVGLVLARTGGALKEFMKPVRLGFAAVLGNGRQMQSWIHIDDVCRIFIYAMENERISGVYNGVAPLPVDHKTLVLELAKQMKGSFFVTMHVPSFVLSWMLGEMSAALLQSLTASSGKIRKEGFQFLFPSIQPAVKDLLSEK
ncbi:MAG: TIGR01777 family oxidoreductase [Chitinophagaceae bacterium]|nr:TIGR01777 family oxidoreductase [Chitinophagaceae bacterium]